MQPIKLDPIDKAVNAFYKNGKVTTNLLIAVENYRPGSIDKGYLALDMVYDDEDIYATLLHLQAKEINNPEQTN